VAAAEKKFETVLNASARDSSGFQSTVLSITFYAILYLEIVFAILLRVLASFAVYLRRTSKPTFTTVVPDAVHTRHRFVAVGECPECPQSHTQRIDGSIWFGAVIKAGIYIFLNLLDPGIRRDDGM
jgi:MFS superfamily sulfate permease-like transporter